MTNLVLKQIIPGLPTQCIADDELEDIKGEACDDAVNLDHSCPSPTNAMNSSKVPFGIHGDDGCQLT